MLKVTDLRKEFATVVAVDGVSIESRRGEILGLIGPNGAGKTTTIRTILNIIQPDSGTITFDNRPFDENLRDKIGYLPEERGLYRKNKLLNTILYFASLKGIDIREAKKRAYIWLERFDLLNKYNSKIEELSKGNQQKIQFIISILHDPELIILDEPFSGLDPVNQILLKDILLDLKQKEKAIIFSTHQMDQAEKLSDEICLINNGRMVLNGSVKDVKKRFGKNSVHLEYDGDGTFLKSLPFVRWATVYENYAEIVLSDNVSSTEILNALSQKIEIRKFEYVEPSLNSIFIEVVGLPVQNSSAGAMEERKPNPKKSTLSDKGVKRELVLTIIFAAVTLIAAFGAIFVKGVGWSMVGIFFLGTAVSFVKYFMMHRNVKKEMQTSSEEGS